MSKERINHWFLADRIIERMEEHCIEKEFQCASLAIAFIKSCKSNEYDLADMIDIILTTKEIYDDSDP